MGKDGERGAQGDRSGRSVLMPHTHAPRGKQIRVCELELRVKMRETAERRFRMAAKTKPKAATGSGKAKATGKKATGGKKK